MFGSGTGSSEILLGRGFDGPLGNGYSNEGSGGGSGSGAATLGANGSSAFDLSDFPSLGGGSVVSVGSGGASVSDNNGLAAALRQQQQQQQILAQQQMLQGAGGNSKTSNLYRLAMGAAAATSGPKFNMVTEDFPALPGAPSPVAGSSGSGLLGGVEGGQREPASGSSTPGPSFGTPAPKTPSNGNGFGMFGGDLEGLTNQLDTTNLLGGGGGLGNFGSLQPSSYSNLPQQRPGSTGQSDGATGMSSNILGSGSAGGSALSGDYGLLGLLGVIRMSDADRNALALGSDLTTLGLNLNSSDQLYSTFASPWSEYPTTREPQYQLPMCYYMQPPALKTGHLSKFQLETLFYIFYALPKDVLQAYAAQELYSREWRYHVDLKLWFKRAVPADGVANNVGGTVQHIYFDINSWECRLFNGNMNQSVTSGLLSEDDIRVKFPNT